MLRYVVKRIFVGSFVLAIVSAIGSNSYHFRA